MNQKLKIKKIQFKKNQKRFNSMECKNTTSYMKLNMKDIKYPTFR